MDKRGVLINRLQEQYQQGADENSLLNTALLLVSELQSLKNAEPLVPGKVSIIMPAKPFEVISNGHPFTEEKQEVPAKAEPIEENEEEADANLDEVMENNILPEADIEPETEQQPEPVVEPQTIQPSSINTLAEEKYNDVIEEVPTLAQQQPKVVFELNDSHQSGEPSINDKLKGQQTEAGNRLQSEPIRDLRKAIGINDKYTFIRELFRNDEAAYERTLKTLNGFNILPEAEYWIQREMKYKLGWDDSNPTVKSFYQLIRRRFS